MKFTKYHKLGAYHWSLYEKNVHYRRHVARLKEWIKETNVLEVGAGDGKITSILDIKGIDNEPEAVRLAQEKGADVVFGDAYHLSAKDEEFGSILMANVLEHFEFPLEALKEARRVLKDYIYIVTPPKNLVPGKMDKFHYQEWTPEELKNLVESEGFSLEGEVLVVPKEKCMYGKFRKI